MDPERYESEETIVALATPAGISAIAVIRLSGKDTFQICNQIFKGKDFTQLPSHSVHFGSLRDGERILDEVLISIFKSPTSFTKEDLAEISCHGSPYIIQEILTLLLKLGARYAKAGEFTKRAFLHGQFDLAQAEAVADLIASDSEVSHRTAMSQMRGGFSEEIKKLRDQLVTFAAMVELELDFAEEDVEFADRQKLKDLVNGIKKLIDGLILSFSLGNVIKNGVPTVIVGKPNAGKSTLLNSLLKEEKAMVSEIAGTTRDTIEDELVLEGVSFRFIDTAGLRETTDTLEAMGIERTRKKMSQAALIIYLFDVNSTSQEELIEDLDELKLLNVPYLVVGNKIDRKKKKLEEFKNFEGIIFISAKLNEGVEELKEKLLEQINLKSFKTGNTIVTNVRHYESLNNTSTALEDVLKGIDSGITGDFLAQDIRQALHFLGEITGEVTTEDLLGFIFSKFCIGK